jgi:AraC-like DNA-binding protein
MKNPIFNTHDLILVLTLAVCALLVIFQWLLSKQKTNASWLLSGFFVGVGLTALCNLLLWNDYIHSDAGAAKTLLSSLLVTAVVGKSVCLYFYVVAIIRAQFRWRWNYALHGLMLFVVIALVIAAGLDSDRLRFLIAGDSEAQVSLTNFFWHYLKALPVIYALAAVWVIWQYKQQLKEFYSTFSPRAPLWLLLLTLGFALNWSWSLVAHVLGQSVGIELADMFGIADNYITFLLVNALFVYSLLYAHELLVTKEKPAEKGIAAVAETSPDAIEKIRRTMEDQQLYLTQNLNIEEFAKHVGIHYREVSSIINQHFNTNFFEFVNEYRVNRAKQMLIDKNFADMTIMDILLESGFNSKSSFHRFFKRYTGMSAADFRKQKQG